MITKLNNSSLAFGSFGFDDFLVHDVFQLIELMHHFIQYFIRFTVSVMGLATRKCVSVSFRPWLADRFGNFLLVAGLLTWCKLFLLGFPIKRFRLETALGITAQLTLRLQILIVMVLS